MDRSCGCQRCSDRRDDSALPIRCPDLHLGCARTDPTGRLAVYRGNEERSLRSGRRRRPQLTGYRANESRRAVHAMPVRRLEEQAILRR